MTIRKPTQIRVTIAWKTRSGGRYAILRWRWPHGKIPQGESPRPSRALGYVSADEAEEERTKLESALRLNLAPTPSAAASNGYTVAALVCDYLAAVESGPTSEAHKRRTAGDCESIGRLLGAFLVEELTPYHVARFMALRARERVVRARQRRGEADDAWERRQAASRVDEHGKPITSTTIRAELATARRAVRWGRHAGKHRAPDLPSPARNAMPEDQRPPRRLTEAEARRIVAAADRPGEAALLEVAAWSGRRPIALFGARIRDCVRALDVTLPRRDRMMFWRRDKAGRRTGWGRLTDPALDAIGRRVAELRAAGVTDPDALLWTQPNGRPWTSVGWPKRFAKLVVRSGVENVMFYDLRKHACAQLLRALGNVYAAIEYSGHKSVETFLKNYAYALDSDDDEGPRVGWTPQPLALVRGTDRGTA